MINVDKINFIKYYGIHESLEFTEIDGIPASAANGYMLVIKKTSGIRNEVPPRVKSISLYECFNSENQSVDFLEHIGWQAGLPSPSYEQLKIIDPYGAVMYTDSWQGISGAIKGLTQFFMISGSKSLEYYNLLRIQERLKKNLITINEEYNTMLTLLESSKT